ncbi:ATP-binding protein [Mycolicibacterium sp. 050232]|uniref:ATP-binding protein n=1 Tax=Mycolicibacterium sp. 050232 TaxID=3113982 RepID=UPI002E2AE751|nr:ATP-binding protein [Mycolicibacterium sp. 050232]MED5812900.1 ATP-binding protein [Mycolicibacterium sp. 050232]
MAIDDMYGELSPRNRKPDSMVVHVGRKRTTSDVVERKVLSPDPGLVKSLGAHHSLPTAVADLVDNSIDAEASRVLIVFEIKDGAASGLTVIDNGRGMTENQADNAMRLGRQRKYNSGAQGHFGIGLKAAAFSHADVLTVRTRPGSGTFHGRRLRRKDFERDYSCEVLDPGVVQQDTQPWFQLLGTRSGTVVQLSDTRFPKFTDSKFDSWLGETQSELRMHLGLVYHRLLTNGQVQIEIQLFDHDLGEAGAPEPVSSIDPFDFPTSAVSGYPKTLTAKIGDSRIDLECDIVPPRASGPEYRLYGRDGAEHQGFFIYRNDRLLQTGGWNQVTTKDKSRGLARVAINDFETIEPFVQMTPEKTAIRFTADLQDALTHARNRSTTFESYLARAGEVLVESKRRVHARRPVVAPGRGLHEEVRRVIGSEIPVRKNEEPVDIRWRAMPSGTFMELDRETRTVYLNRRYRDIFTGGANGLSDAPLLKSLVYLLTEDHFTGERWGSRDKDLIDIWNSVLGAAVRTEVAYREGRLQ